MYINVETVKTLFIKTMNNKTNEPNIIEVFQ